jgi:uncharacterized protein
MNITAYFYVPFTAWAVAQLIKFSLSLIKGDVDFRYLYASGGMPSVHSAVVCSLATWALIEGGLSSPLFGITAILAGIVMYDSFGVRRSSGEQAKTINKLIDDLSNTGGLKNSQDYSRLREILGHKPLEVIAGAILGVFIAGCFGYQKLSEMFPAIFATADSYQSKIIMAGGALLIATVIPVYIYAVRRYKKNSKAKTALTYIALCNAVAGLVLVVSGLLAYERLDSIFAKWYFVALVLAVWLIAVLAFKLSFWQNRKSHQPSASQSRKAEWLKKANKKKK